MSRSEGIDGSTPVRVASSASCWEYCLRFGASPGHCSGRIVIESSRSWVQKENDEVRPSNFEKGASRHSCSF